MKIIIVSILICILLNGLMFYGFVKEKRKDQENPISSLITDSNFWTAFGALNTFFAIILVLIIPKWIEYTERPKIKISLYNNVIPHVRMIKPTGAPSEETILLLTLSIRNLGETTAEKSRIFITNAATYEKNEWKFQNDWAPIPLYLIKGQISSSLMNSRELGVFKNQKDNFLSLPLDKGFYHDFDIFPNRPYLFDLGAFNYLNKKNNFNIFYADIFQNQKEDYENGNKHCFEISVYSKNSKPEVVYVIIEWKGDPSVKVDEIGQRLKVNLENMPPW